MEVRIQVGGAGVTEQVSMVGGVGARRRWLVDVAAIHAGAGVVLGIASASRRLPRRARPLHHLAYFGTTAGTVGALLVGIGRPMGRSLLLALGALAWLPRTRPGTRRHASIASTATCALVVAARAGRRSVSRRPVSGDP